MPMLDDLALLALPQFLLHCLHRVLQVIPDSQMLYYHFILMVVFIVVIGKHCRAILWLRVQVGILQGWRRGAR
jgi:hypothetical protein